MLLLKRWPKEAFHKLCAERWDVDNDEHSHKETQRSETGPLSYMSWTLREMQETKTQRLLSRPGPESSAQRSHGAKKPAEEGGAWIICAEGRRPDKYSEGSLDRRASTLPLCTTPNPLWICTHISAAIEKGINKQEEYQCWRQGISGQCWAWRDKANELHTVRRISWQWTSTRQGLWNLQLWLALYQERQALSGGINTQQP